VFSPELFRYIESCGKVNCSRSGNVPRRSTVYGDEHASYFDASGSAVTPQFLKSIRFTSEKAAKDASRSGRRQLYDFAPITPSGIHVFKTDETACGFLQ
jgi:hypothetical protein